MERQTKITEKKGKELLESLKNWRVKRWYKVGSLSFLKVKKKIATREKSREYRKKRESNLVKVTQFKRIPRGKKLPGIKFKTVKVPKGSSRAETAPMIQSAQARQNWIAAEKSLNRPLSPSTETFSICIVTSYGDREVAEDFDIEVDVSSGDVQKKINKALRAKLKTAGKSENLSWNWEGDANADFDRVIMPALLKKSVWKSGSRSVHIHYEKAGEKGKTKRELEKRWSNSGGIATSTRKRGTWYGSK